MKLNYLLSYYYKMSFSHKDVEYQSEVIPQEIIRPGFGNCSQPISK